MKNPATRALSGSPVTRVPSTRGRSRRVRPASWAAIITAARAVVATSPISAHPAQSISASSGLVGLGGEAGEHVLEGLVEAGDALVLQGQADVVHVDSGGGQPAHHLVCVRHAGVDGAGQGAVILEGGDGETQRLGADGFESLVDLGID